MNAALKWGLPDWTDATAYPRETTDAIWRWEFLRRRPDYRTEWERWQDHIDGEGGIRRAITDDHKPRMLRFGVAVIYDPSQRFDHWTAWQLFRSAHGFTVTYDRERRDDGRLVDYRFDLGRPLQKQMKKAHEHLMRLQQELHGKKNTPKPSREKWGIYLRVLDARDCNAGWGNIGKTLWPNGGSGAKDRARRTHDLAKAVRDNFPA